MSVKCTWERMASSAVMALVSASLHAQVKAPSAATPASVATAVPLAPVATGTGGDPAGSKHTAPAQVEKIHVFPGLAGAGLSGLTIGHLAAIQRDALEAEAAKRAGIVSAHTMPAAAPVQPATPVYQPPPRQAQLVAIVSKQGSVQFTEWREGANSKTVDVGDRILGWILTEVEPGAVRLRRDGSADLQLGIGGQVSEKTVK